MNAASEVEREIRILIVDDDAGTIKVLAEILKDVGKIHFTTKGEKALSMAQTVMPDIILLDVEMPDMNGFEVCEAIKRNPGFQDVPVMFVTSHADIDIETRALTSGAIDFIHKPPHPMVVKARVSNYLALKKQTERLKMLSMVDGLTGIANRRAFDDALKQEWQRACRNHQQLSLLMIDVDHFKIFNDTYGHQAGDDCLRMIADVLDDTARRPGEMAARYGGEEFTVLLPNCTESQAVFLAEMICTEIRKLKKEHSGSPVAPYVTVSIGVSSMLNLKKGKNCWSGDEGNQLDSPYGLTYNDLLNAADRALYAAKHQGRNRVSIGITDSLGDSTDQFLKAAD